MKRALLSIAMLVGLAVGAGAAQERAFFDLNQIPGIMGVDSASGEMRRIRTNSIGAIIISGGLSGTADALSMRCVSIDGTTFESCGSGPAIIDVNIISTFSATNPGFVNANQNGLWTIDNAAGASAVNIQDGGNSLTVDDGGTTISIDDGGGSITVDGVFNAIVEISSVQVDNVPGTTLAIDDDGGSITIDDGGVPLDVAQSGTWILGSNSGVDIGDVTVNNTSGAGAVFIQDGGNSITIDAVSLPLPTGAATEASLSSIDGKMAALGQALMSGSMPVAIASNQTVIPVNDNGGSLTVDGTITANQGGSWSVSGIGTFTTDPIDRAARVLGRAFLRNPGDTANMGDATTPIRVDPTGTTTQPVSDAGGSLTVDDGGGSISVDQSGAWILSANSGVDIGDVTINNPSGGGSVNIQDGGNSITIDDGGGSITVDGAITADINGSSVQVSNVAGTSLAINDDGGSITIDAASLPLPTGAATSALQTTGNSSLSSIDGKMASLGQKASAGSMPVVLASDQSAIPVSQSGAWTVTANAGTGNFASNITQFAGTAVSVDAGTTDAGTQRIIIASDQSAIPVTGSFGVPTSASVSKSSVTLDGGVSREIFAANGSRNGWECRALTTNTDTIFLNLGAGAAVITDWPMEPGDYYTPTEILNYTGAIQAIELSGSQVIRCQEF